MELWEVIKGHSSAYLISSYGRVFNQITGKYLKPAVGNNGYYHLTLCYGKKEDCAIHRLVALYFLKNENNYKYINHKDENKLNNNVSNLEWCTAKYNVTYGAGALARNTKVIQKDNDGNMVKEWDSIKEAAETLGIKYQGISRVCRGFRKTSGGYRWEYAS